VLGHSEGGLGRQDAPGGFPVSGRNAARSGVNAFFADLFFQPYAHFEWHEPYVVNVCFCPMLWVNALGLYFGPILWSYTLAYALAYALGLCFGPMLWAYSLGLCFGPMLWAYPLGLSFGPILWAYPLGQCFGPMLWVYALGICFGLMLWAYALGLCSGRML